MDDRERERDDSTIDDSPEPSGVDPERSFSSSTSSTLNSIDVLFDRENGRTAWEPVKPAPALGELLDSRFMLPLLLPSDPKLLAATPSRSVEMDPPAIKSPPSAVIDDFEVSSGSDREHGVFSYRCRTKKLRDVGVDTLQWVDGYRAAARFLRPVHLEEDEIERPETPRHPDDVSRDDHDNMEDGLSPLTRIPSMRRTKSTAPTPTDAKGPTLA
jgi:hypothetical protein